MAISEENRKRFEAITLPEIRRELVVGNVKYLRVSHGGERDQAQEWVTEQEAKIAQETEARKKQEADAFRVANLTLWAAVAAVLVGIIGVMVTWFQK
jgi:nitrate reductase NapE component